MRKILFLSSWYPTKVDNLNGNFVKNHATAISSKNSVELIYAISDSNIDTTFVYSFNQVNKNFKEHIMYYKYSENRFVRIFRMLLSYYKLVKKIDDFEILVSNVFFNSAIIAAIINVFYNKKIICIEHSTLFESNLKFINHPFNYLAFNILKSQISKFCPVSENLKSVYMNYGIKSLDIQIVYNAIDEEVFYPKNIKNTSDIVEFLHVSNFRIGHKNIEGIIKAIELLATNTVKFRFTFAGDGDLDYVKNLAISHNVERNIRLIGKSTPTELAQLYNQSDCFVLFSYKENNPTVILEALMCGTYCISSNVGNLYNFINKSNGVLIEGLNHIDLARELETFANSTEKSSRSDISDNIKPLVSNTAISNNFDKIFDEVICK